MATAENTCDICKFSTPRPILEHIRDRHPINKIGTHAFQLVSKNLTDSYLLVKIINLTYNFSFIVYRSNSHGGIFRLCTRTSEGSGHLYKGETDYVTQTFIHMDLQKFIIENISKLLDDSILITNSCPPITSKIVPSNPKSLTYKELVDGTNEYRKFYYKALDILTDIDCGTGFSNGEQFISSLMKMASLPYFHEIRNKIMQIINPAFDLNTISQRSSSFGPLILEEYKRVKPDIKKRKQIMRAYLEYVSNHLYKEFNVLHDTNKELYKDTFTIPKIEAVEIQITYYSINIKPKRGEDIFKVIYGIYKISSPKYRELNGTYSITFNIMPLIIKKDGNDYVNDINRIGLYKFYISAGIFLCKIFDYDTQVRAIAHNDRIYGDYVFLGELYHNLFPLN